MKTNSFRVIFVSALALAVGVTSSFAQRQLGKKKGPTSKLYMAEAEGESQIQNGDKIYTARQATAFDAPGTVIETKANSHNALVFSNGTGLYVDESTHVEINRFVQEPFRPERNSQVDAPFEPSVSQSDVFVSHGAVGVCTTQLISGSSMLYSTPHGEMNIRGGRVSIESNSTGTVIDLLEGDVTVRHNDHDIGGQILRPGERATIHPPTAVGLKPVVTISPIPREALQAAEERTSTACNAKKSVTFEVIEKKAEMGLDQPAGEEIVASGTPPSPAGPSEAAGAGTEDSTQEIVAKPTVPENPPTNIVISPDRLPGT
jgi:hypothetical protein